MQPYNIDTSVLMLFHARADHFAEVWAEVRKARPARLFLYQDGPRAIDSDGNPVTRPEDSRDWPGILACRELVKDENIDWQCDVHRLYQEKNYGCDPSEYLSQKWAFSITDKCIVLEDDDVPSQSFFPFCKELLDKYENDERVWMISGFNSEESFPWSSGGGSASYLFTSVFAIWGWASWRRVIDTWDATYSWMDDAEKLAKVERVVREKRLRKDFLQMCRDHKASGKEYYETIFWTSMLLNDALAIMPTLNLVNNHGVTDNSTHFQGSLQTMPRRLRQQFTMKRHEIEFPLVHPTEVAECVPFKEAVYRRNAWGHPFIKVQYSIEELFLNIRHGNFRIIRQAILNRLRKNLGIAKHK